jgi:hypothetical protein
VPDDGAATVVQPVPQVVGRLEDVETWTWYRVAPG